MKFRVLVALRFLGFVVPGLTCTKLAEVVRCFRGDIGEEFLIVVKSDGGLVHKKGFCRYHLYAAQGLP
jgi:hypothetical protein